jgi:hypothetical protein
MEELDLGGDLTYSERPNKIFDTVERVTRNKVVKMYKVQSSHQTEDEATWEHEEEVSADYPELFLSMSESRGRDSTYGGKVCNTLNFEFQKFTKKMHSPKIC